MTRGYTIHDTAIREAAYKLRRLRLTESLGRKENPSQTVKSVMRRGLGGSYDDDAIAYMLTFGVKYYVEACREHGVHPDPVREKYKDR
jgi:hypothetical protein